MPIVINTPAGHIGQRLTSTLLDAGQQVTIISRNPAKVAGLVAKGAKLVEGSIDDESTLARAFDGACGVFWLSPPISRPDHEAWTQANGERAARLAKAAGMECAVVLSSVGAHQGPGRNGPVGGLRDVESRFFEALPDVAVLRAGFFMENLFNYVATIATQSTVYAAAPAELKMPWVATSDIADAAASWLLSCNWSGHHIVGVHGAQDLSYAQAVEVIGRELGRPVQYVSLPVEQIKQAMMGMGMPDFVANIMGGLLQGINDGTMKPAEPRTPATTTPTTLARFSREVLVPAIQGFKG